MKNLLLIVIITFVYIGSSNGQTPIDVGIFTINGRTYKVDKPNSDSPYIIRLNCLPTLTSNPEMVGNYTYEDYVETVIQIPGYQSAWVDILLPLLSPSRLEALKKNGEWISTSYFLKNDGSVIFSTIILPKKTSFSMIEIDSISRAIDANYKPEIRSLNSGHLTLNYLEIFGGRYYFK
ncbi:hypothetical protein [Sphingobacterium lactis]|uniref:Uncharacterized protein n=1 Tax=Sphingobacterium lactis TaxID=797291 RepID=A0A1H5V7K7_9SPHI|nr:hypothetical protein [Sphingobacterium lactis]SEF83194.1 hypothetical protein SAMN05421877_10339 [Sphingobacterium lactis]